MSHGPEMIPSDAGGLLQATEYSTERTCAMSIKFDAALIGILETERILELLSRKSEDERTRTNYVQNLEEKTRRLRRQLDVATAELVDVRQQHATFLEVKEELDSSWRARLKTISRPPFLDRDTGRRSSRAFRADWVKIRNFYRDEFEAETSPSELERSQAAYDSVGTSRSPSRTSRRSTTSASPIPTSRRSSPSPRGAPHLIPERHVDESKTEMASEANPTHTNTFSSVPPRVRMVTAARSRVHASPILADLKDEDEAVSTVQEDKDEDGSEAARFQDED